MSNTRISVSVRVRPLNKRELKAGEEKSWEVQGSTIMQKNPLSQKVIPNVAYTFDNIFGEEVSSTSVVFDKAAKTIIQQALDGMNGTIFAYGQTSSGESIQKKFPTNKRKPYFH